MFMLMLFLFREKRLVIDVSWKDVWDFQAKSGTTLQVLVLSSFLFPVAIQASIATLIAWYIGAEIWEGDERRKIRFADSGGSLNGLNLFSEWPFFSDLTKALIH